MRREKALIEIIKVMDCETYSDDVRGWDSVVLRYIAFYTNDNSQLDLGATISVVDGSGDDTSICDNVIVYGEWQHVIMIFDNDGIRVYRRILKEV